MTYVDYKEKCLRAINHVEVDPAKNVIAKFSDETWLNFKTTCEIIVIDI